MYLDMNHLPSSSLIMRTVYRFGGVSGGHYGYIVLRGDGRVGFYSNPNEVFYEFCEDQLSFMNEAGKTTSRLFYHRAANAFLGNELYLLPVLHLEEPLKISTQPPLVINSIPKSGTYFIEAALAKLGMCSLNLHISSDFLHDYRGVDQADMHRKPAALAVNVPAAALAEILCVGEMVVGHIDEHIQLDKIGRLGVRVLHVVRDLREVLVSLYHFKKNRVEPVSPGDVVWRTLPLEAGFIAFLSYFETLDIAHIMRMTEIILARPEPMLQYEQMVQGIVPPEANLSGLGESLSATFNQPTSTLSGRDRSLSLWSPTIEEFFVASGMHALNKKLGYG